MITLKSQREIEIMARAGRIVAATLELVRRTVRPGVTTSELDDVAEKFIRSHPGATPSFKGLYGFPRSLCVSINDEIVHGIPSRQRVLREGSIDRKSTRLNSSHGYISYAVFCLKKKNNN